MLSREEVARRILALPPEQQAKAAELALKVYGPAPRVADPESREARAWTARIEAMLPVPHAKQLEIENSRAKRKVICAGRRAGKTTLAARAAVQRALKGKRVLLTSTSQDQADAFWEKCTTWLGEAIERKAVKKNEGRRILTFPLHGGRIKVKTAREPDELRGDYCDFFVGDEAARLKATAWSEVVAPMLADTDGEAWLISTPDRINWFFERYQRGVADGERWRSWHFTTHDNPHLSEKAVAELESDMESEEAYRQEILAEFLPGEGAVFSNLDRALVLKKSTPDEHRRHVIIQALDWGQANDYTVIDMFCVTCNCEVWIERMRRQLWEVMRARAVTLYQEWGATRCYPEENSVGLVNIEELEKQGVPCEPFNTNPASKPRAVQALKVCFEKLQAQWLDDPVARGEAQAYESSISPKTGRVSYSAPEGMHDDTVVARFIIWQAAMNAGPIFGAEAAAVFTRGR